MFIESFQKAHGQLKQAETAPPKRYFTVTSEGNSFYIIGGLALLASFFFPALTQKEQQFFPFQAIGSANLSLNFVPLLYLFGLSTTLMVGIGRFRKAGVPGHVVVLHTLLSVVLILGTGVIFHISLLSEEVHFGITITSLALLCWWPLFIRLLFSWLWGKRPLLSRVLSTTWISAACGGLIYLIVILDVLYTKRYEVSYGLLVSTGAILLIMIGGMKNESHSNRA